MSDEAEPLWTARGRWLPAVASVIAALAPSAARGGEAPAEPTVDVTVVGGDRDAQAVLEAVHEPLAALGLHVHTGPPPEDAMGQAIRVRIEIREEATELVIEGVHEGRPAIVRSLPRDPSAPRAILAEDIAYAVRATLESILEEPPPVPVPPAIPPPVALERPPPLAPATVLAPPLREERFGIDVAALGNVRGVGSVPYGPSQGNLAASGGALGGDVALWGRRPFRPTLWVIVTVDAPTQVMTSEVELSMMVYSARVLPSVELGRAGPLRFAVGAGGGIDVFQAHAAPADVVPVRLADPTRVDGVLGLSAIVRARLFDSAGLFLSGALDYDVNPHDFAEKMGASSLEVFTPWRVRPGLFLGVCFRVTGASGCAGPP